MKLFKNDIEKYSQCIIKRHQTVFVHIIWIKREAAGHRGRSTLRWNGKGCDDWQPLRGSQLVQNSTGNVLVKLLLTCCPIWDRGGTWEVFKKRGIHTQTHTQHSDPYTQHTQSHTYAHSEQASFIKLYRYWHDFCINWKLKIDKDWLITYFIILASITLYNTFLLKGAQWSYRNKLIPYT